MLLTRFLAFQSDPVFKDRGEFPLCGPRFLVSGALLVKAVFDFFSAVCRLVAPPEWLLPCGVPGVSVGGGLSSLGHLVGQGFLRLFLPAASEAHHRSACCLVGVSTFLPRGAVSSFGCLRCQRLSSLFSATYRVKCSTRVEAFFSVPRLPCRGARFLVSVAFVVKGFLPLFTAPTERFHQGWRSAARHLPAQRRGGGYMDRHGAHSKIFWKTILKL